MTEAVTVLKDDDGQILVISSQVVGAQEIVGLLRCGIARVASSEFAKREAPQ